MIIINWKDELNDFFIKNKMFRVKYLNDMLHDYLKEYVTYVNEYNEIKAKFNEITTHLLKDIKLGVIEVIVDTSSFPDKFNLECYFNEFGYLCLKYPTEYDYLSKLRKALKPIAKAMHEKN